LFLATFQLFSIYPIVQQCTVNASLYDDGAEEVDNNTVITECEMIDNKEERVPNQHLTLFPLVARNIVCAFCRASCSVS